MSCHTKVPTPSPQLPYCSTKTTAAPCCSTNPHPALPVYKYQHRHRQCACKPATLPCSSFDAHATPASLRPLATRRPSLGHTNTRILIPAPASMIYCPPSSTQTRSRRQHMSFIIFMCASAWGGVMDNNLLFPHSAARLCILSSNALCVCSNALSFGETAIFAIVCFAVSLLIPPPLRLRYVSSHSIYTCYLSVQTIRYPLHGVPTL